MEEAIDDPARREVLQVLVSDGDLDASDLAAALDLEADDVYDHLDELVDVGLVHFRQRNDPDRPGIDSRYRASTLGEGNPRARRHRTHASRARLPRSVWLNGYKSKSPHPPCSMCKSVFLPVVDV